MPPTLWIILLRRCYYHYKPNTGVTVVYIVYTCRYSRSICYTSFAGENKDWDAYIHSKLPRWPLQIVNLLTEAKLSQRPVHILQFEDLKSDTARELKKVADFLGFSYSLEEVTTRLQAGFTKFYRNHTAQFSHFTAGQEQYIHDVVYRTSQVMRENGLYELFPRIDDYL